jgi:hypothetical protein
MAAGGGEISYIETDFVVFAGSGEYDIKFGELYELTPTELYGIEEPFTEMGVGSYWTVCRLLRTFPTRFVSRVGDIFPAESCDNRFRVLSKIIDNGL